MIDKPQGRAAADRPLRRPRTLKEALGPASQAEMYLMRALEEFHHSANAPDLWVPVGGLLRGSRLESAQAVGTAKDRRLRSLRGTVLFAALAIEAFANELMAELLPRRDFDAVDRLEVPDKLLIGTRLATGHQSPLSRGTQPLQDVAIVVKTRNRLVHAKPQNGIAAWVRDVTAADEAAVGPHAALNALLRVGEMIVVCTELREYPNLHGGVAKTIVNHRQLLVRHKDQAGPKIADVPAQDAEGVAPLWDQMQEAIAASAGLRRGDQEASA